MLARADLERLSEGQVVEPVELSLAEATALATTNLVTVQPGVGGWRVTAAHAVGAVRCGNLRVRVQPKVGTVQVLRLLARAHGIRGLRIDESLIEVHTDPELTVVLAALFAEEAATAMAAGPLRGYRTEDQTANVLRGRLRMREQELRRFGLPLPLEVTIDDWTADTTENRRIRAATRRLLNLPYLPAGVRARLLRTDRVLADVWAAPRGAVLPSWTSTRLNVRMHRLLLLSDLVLDQATVEHRIGDIEVHGFALSMSWLFERLVTQLLTENRGRLSLHAQRTFPLDTFGRLTIRPDLIFADRERVVAVADTKYKLMDDNGNIPNPDVYQLVTYCTRLGLAAGHLIYATDQPHRESFEIIGTGVQLGVHAVDLGRSVGEIEERVRQTLELILATQLPDSGHRPLSGG